MLYLPDSVKNEYKDFNREIKVYGELYLAEKTIVNGEYVINYTLFPLDEENNSKILSFKINQKADVYYTSLPYNTMTIEVDNEHGYFTDFDENSIIEQLNEDCYVIIYMQINDGDLYSTMRMDFDKISYSDYEKAKLSFYSNLARLEKYELKDKNNAFSVWIQQFSQLKTWIEDNYNVSVISDHPDFVNDTTLTADFELVSSKLKDTLLNVSTYKVGQIRHQGVLLTNNNMNNLSFKAITNEISETIPTDLQLERTIIKKENTYKGVKYDWTSLDFVTPYIETDETYSKSIQGTLQLSEDTIIIVDYEYRLSDITINDITTTMGNISVSVIPMDLPTFRNAVKLKIQGNIGELYEINITKTNIYKRNIEKITTWSGGDTTDTTKILEVKEEAPIESAIYVFLYIKKPIISNVEIRIMGLPYLEIGDTIKVELDNRYVAMFITEINTTYDNGFLQTIKGYELDWTHQSTGIYARYGDLNDWGFLYPSNDLYPSQSLYPNQL